MSKRFGRNQRRQMREALSTQAEQLESSARYNSRLLNESSDLRARLVKWADTVRHLLGEDSAFNERVRTIGAYSGDTLMLRSRSPLLATRIPYEKTAPVTVDTVIEALIWRATLRSDDLGRQVAIRLQAGHEVLGYAMNVDRLRQWTPRDVDEIALLIAQEMSVYAMKSAA